MKTFQQHTIDTAIANLESLKAHYQKCGDGFTAVHSVYRSIALDLEVVIKQLKQG